MVQYSQAARNAGITAMTDAVGAAPVLQIRTGPTPVDCASPPAGVLLATIALPTPWLSPAALGIRSLAGVWQALSADTSGVAGHYRILDGSICHQQGSISVPGGGGDMVMTDVNVALGEPITVTTATMGVGGA